MREEFRGGEVQLNLGKKRMNRRSSYKERRNGGRKINWRNSHKEKMMKGLESSDSLPVSTMSRMWFEKKMDKGVTAWREEQPRFDE